MGDYNYRGTPSTVEITNADGDTQRRRIYNAGGYARGASCHTNGPYTGQNSPGSRTPDTWAAWQADFFEPAATLLQAAPWVFARGNHELCSRGGTWLVLLARPGFRSARR